MDRLTGKDAQLMMEALASVYTKEEVEQEVISEEVDQEVISEEVAETEELQENQAANRARQQRLRQQQSGGNRAQQQLGAKPRPAGSFRNRIFARRSASPAARANTNRYGQNIKVGPITGPAQNDQLKKPTGTASAPAAPTSMANKAPAKDNMAGASKEDRMAAWAKANPKLAAAKAARDASRGTSASTNPMMKDMPGKRPAPAPTGGAAKPAAAKPAMSGPGGYTLSSGAKPKANLGAKNPMSTPMTVSTPSGSNTYQPGQRMSTADTATMQAAQQQFRPKPTGSPAAQAAAGAPNRKEDLFTGKPIPSAAGSAGPAAKAAVAPVVKKKPMSGRARARMEEVDIFETIKEYLIGEGYNEDEALKAMTVLTDEERTEILEGLFDFLPRSVTVVPPANMRDPEKKKAYVKQRGAAARKDIKRQDAGMYGRKDGRIPEFRVDVNPNAMKKPSQLKNSYEAVGELVDEGSCGSKKKKKSKKGGY